MERKGWFPKFDDTFLAMYQTYNYQYVEPEKKDKKESANKKEQKDDDSLFKKPGPVSAKSDEDQDKASTSKSDQDEETSKSKLDQILSKQPVKKQPEWFQIDEERNTSVYVSNLPDDLTDEEFYELMKRGGVILKDSETNRYKLKLYRTSDGKLKGDGLCTYVRPESVTIALQSLDEYPVKDKIIRVEPAKFELKGEFNPSLKPRKRKLEDKKKQRKKIERLFSWQEKEPDKRPKSEKVVIIKNFFNPEVFDKDPTLIVEYKQDVEEECTEKCGPIRKVDIYDRNPEGVVAVFFKEFEHADECVSLMNGRFFDGRRLSAENWDGRTKYKVKETEEEEQRRIEEWNRYLEEEE